MSQVFLFNTLAALGNVQYRQQIVITDDLAAGLTVPQVPQAQPAILTTRTSNTVGTLTMNNAAHGITTGQRIDLYWQAGGVWFARSGVTVGTVSGTSVPFTGGAGTNLPAATTAIVVGIPQQVVAGITGDNVSAALLVAPGNAPAMFVFDSSAPADLLSELVQPAAAFSWYAGSGVSNPFAGLAIASVWVSHGVFTATDVSGAVLTH